MMGEDRTIAGAAAALLLAILPLAPPAQACVTEPLGQGQVTGHVTGHVAAIEDSRTLRLADGRRIRLAGVELGVSPERARAALSALVLDRQITLNGLAKPGTGTDRYGRIHAFPSVNGSETPIQYALLDRGLAVTGTRIGDPACRAALLARERAARAARLGIWGSGDYRLHQADDPATILQSVGRFAIVEGRVLSVRESGSTVYVNFGRRWSEDFTVTIAKRAEPTFIAAGLTPRSLAGRIVRVRGVIEDRAGPWIEATGADQFDWDGRP
jgi:endonuclease YncB( thermonuclease family)